MTAWEWVLVAVAAALLVACVLLWAVLRQARGEVAEERSEAAATRAEVGRLRERLAAAEATIEGLRALPDRGPETPAGAQAHPQALDRREGALDQRERALDQRGQERLAQIRLAAGETRVDRQVVERMVRVAGVVHGVRRAISPKGRNRVRFEYKQAVKRARKQRKAETRQAVREYRAKVRAARQEPAA